MHCVSNERCESVAVVFDVDSKPRGLVADVTGAPFEDYAREHLFDPLEMDRSTFE